MGVEHNHCAGLRTSASTLPLQILKLLIQRFFSHFLQPVIYRQHKVISRNRLFFCQHLHHAPRNIDLYLAATISALYKAVILAFQS